MGNSPNKRIQQSNSLKEKIDSGKCKLIPLNGKSYRGSPWKSHFELKGKIYGTSYEKVNFSTFNGLTLINGYYKAYEEHCPIVISPDIIWLLIVQAFANHVNFNAEKLRSLFVDFQGQKVLQVFLGKSRISELTSADYQRSFEEFSSQIEQYIGKEKKELFDFNFSTTTPTIRTVGYTSLMSGMQKFFIYEIHLCGCGIPYILLEGEVNDWIKIKETLPELFPFMLNLEKWLQRVQEIIDKIINEFSAPKPDTKFWNDFIHKATAEEHGLSGRGRYNVDAIEGWLLEFYPYKPDGYIRQNMHGPVKVKKISDTFSRDILITPVKVVEDITKMSYELEIRSGFLGMTKNEKEDHLVRPEIGWVISEKCEDYKPPKKDKKD